MMIAADASKGDPERIHIVQPADERSDGGKHQADDKVTDGKGRWPHLRKVIWLMYPF